MPTTTSTAKLEVRTSPELHTSVIRLTLADQECFAQTLMSPPKPNAALKRAFARRKKLLKYRTPQH